MSTINTVCVYCGSSNHVDQAHKDVARQTGLLLAKENMDLIYGGGHVGLMGIIADSALEAKGRVIGIIPHHLHEREIQHTGLSELRVVNDMRTRKRMMEECSDAFVILPGGFGTLDEAFEIMTERQIGLHTKPIIVINTLGFWNPLLALIDNIINSGFATKETRSIFTVIDSPADLITALHAEQAPPCDPQEKWI